MPHPLATRAAQAAILLLLLLLGAPLRAQEAARADAARPATIVLVRHAEDAEVGPDPSLTEAGRQRVAALTEVLRGAGLDAVHTTHLARTRETGEPVARALGARFEAHEIRGGPGVEEHVRRMVERLRTRHAGETVLVVGHSNTVPRMVEALTGVPVAPLTEAQFDRLYVVVPAPDGRLQLLQARY